MTRPAERAARGFDATFHGGEPHVLLTGFDPFHLDRNVGQSNPSGLAALALDDTLVAGARIRTAILPVCYAAFDGGVVEQLLAPHFKAGLRVLLTVSMGRDRFDLERFPGLRRSAETPDNRNVASGGSPAARRYHRGSSVPSFRVHAARSSHGRDAGTLAGPRQPTGHQLGAGRGAPGSLAALRDDTAVAGSGGGYLSNEVAYRALEAARTSRRVVRRWPFAHAAGRRLRPGCGARHGGADPGPGCGSRRRDLTQSRAGGGLSVPGRWDEAADLVADLPCERDRPVVAIGGADGLEPDREAVLRGPRWENGARQVGVHDHAGP